MKYTLNKLGFVCWKKFAAVSSGAEVKLLFFTKNYNEIDSSDFFSPLLTEACAAFKRSQRLGCFINM